MAVISKSMFYILRVSGLLPMTLSTTGQKVEYSQRWLLYSTALLMVLSFVSLARTWYLFTENLTEFGFWSELTNYTAIAIGAFSVLSSFFCSVACVAMAVITNRGKITILEKLLEVDFLIQQKNPSRTITIVSHLAVIHMCTLIVYACSFSFTFFSWDTVGQLCKLVSTCALVEFMVVVLNIRERFERVNQGVVEAVTQRQLANPLWVVTLPSVETVTDHQTMTIPELSVIHWTLCTIVHDTSDIYGPHIVACMIFIVGHLIFNPYHLFMNFSRGNLESIILSANWLAIYVTHLYVLVWPCSLVVRESGEALRTVSLLMCRRLDDQLFHELEQYAHQLMHRDVVFTGCGLFTLDAAIIVTIGSAVSTYLAIIIQIHSYTANKSITPPPWPTTDYSPIMWNSTEK